MDLRQLRERNHVNDGVPNSLNLNCKVRVMKEAPGPLVSEEIADIFRPVGTMGHCDVTITGDWPMCR